MLLSFLPVALLALEVQSQTLSSTSIILSGGGAPRSSIANWGGDLVPTGSAVSYISYSTTSSIDGSVPLLGSTFAVANGSSPTASSFSRTSTRFSLLQGSAAISHTSSLNATVIGNSTRPSPTSSSITPTNTQSCNNYPEFCDRKYSNITYVGAHNSPFVNPNNAAANQELGVFDQLNDGVRMLQGQTHYNASTDTISYCHTSCDLLNAGSAESYFRNVTRWVRSHPYDVLTLLIGNADLIGVRNYTKPLEESGLSRYAYIPTQVPMNISSWPTLASMILMGKRVVIFLDYQANQTEVPYILDEFSQAWETPFSPTNRSFPCTRERPPGLTTQDAKQRLYIANHNLNTEISLVGTSLLVPTRTLLNETNAIEGLGSLGRMASDCAGDWSRPPNFLLVDYYNQGSYPGSVFEAAAQQNNVTYDRPCCGMVPSFARSKKGTSSTIIIPITLVVALYMAI